MREQMTYFWDTFFTCLVLAVLVHEGVDELICSWNRHTNEAGYHFLPSTCSHSFPCLFQKAERHVYLYDPAKFFLFSYDRKNDYSTALLGSQISPETVGRFL